MDAMRLIGYTSLVAIVCSGCGPSPTADGNSVAAEPAVAVQMKGKQTVAFRVHEMGNRLKLL